LPQSELQQKIATKKYPFLKDEFISVDELRNRVYHGTMGVFPVRQSQAIEELNFMMKGKSVNINTNHDEGIDEPETGFEETEFKTRVNLNTPASFDQDDTAFMSPRSSLDSPLQNYTQSVLLKPAILPQTGNSTSVKMSERPRPAKKLSTVHSPPLKHKKSSQNDQKNIDLSNLNEQERQNLEFLGQVKDLVNEAKQITNLNTKKSKNQKRKSKVDVLQDDVLSGFESSTMQNLDSSNRNIHGKMLLKSVEDLVIAIKSGQLVKEQENSDEKIFEILETILDKNSLDEMKFKTNDDSSRSGDENRSDIDAILTQDNQAKLNDEINQSYELSKTSIQEQIDGTDTNEDKAKESLKNEEKLSLENEHKVSSIKKLSYEEEIDQYLASLPGGVTHEDIISINASKSKFIERNIKGDDFKPKIVQEQTIKEKFARNLHYFCMLEEERRGLLLLPDELKNITRKFHTRDKYEHVN
jgi:hypothetical protein